MTVAFVGIDIGTYESKGVLVGQRGRILGMARRRHGILTPGPGMVEQDPEGVWWKDLTAISKELAKVASDEGVEVAGIGVSAIGPCVVCLDSDLRPLRPGILYGVDVRADAQIRKLNERFGPQGVLDRAGNALSSQSGTPKIAWVVDNEPEVAEKTSWYCTSHSYLVARMTGRVVMDRYTASYYHLLYDSATDDWNTADLEDIVTLDQLPELVWSNEIIGELQSDAAEEMGLPPGIPITAGTTDASAEAVSCSVVMPGDMMLMYGSSSYMIEVTDRYIRDEVLWSAPYLFPGTYGLAAGTSTAGTVTRWLCDILGIDQSKGDSAMFGEMMDLARSAKPGSSGAIFVPHLSGERTPVHDSTSRGTIAGISLETGRAEFARAGIEGVAHSVTHALDRYRQVGYLPKRIFAVGGGTQNEILLQTVSSLTGVTQTVVHGPGASLGDAMLAANGTGNLAIENFNTWSQFGETIDVNTSRLLMDDHQDYVSTYQAMTPLYEKRNT